MQTILDMLAGLFHGWLLVNLILTLIDTNGLLAPHGNSHEQLQVYHILVSEIGAEIDRYHIHC